MLLYFLILKAVSPEITVFRIRFFSVVIPKGEQPRPGIQECGLLSCFLSARVYGSRIKSGMTKEILFLVSTK